MVYAVRVSGRTAPGGSPGEEVVAFERAHGQALFGFARRLGVTDGQAADVAQEALLRLFDALSAGQPIRDARAWTFHVAYRLAIDHHRGANSRRRLIGRLAPVPSVANDETDHIARRELWAAVDRLPQRQRAVVYLRYQADLDFDAIGTVLGITPSAARSHCTQALARLRERLLEEVSES
jgi:RNA polymerase sigma factor (sigma-70 family)